MSVDQLEELLENSTAKDIVSTEEKRLTLAYENLTEIPKNFIADYAPIIETLDLSHNQILDIGFLSHFPKLTTLILDHNLVSDNSVFPELPGLTTLWLNHNKIANLHPFIPRLSNSCKGIRYLSLMGNESSPSYLNNGTYYQYLQYRLFVISWLPELEYLDDRQVTSDQRDEAMRLYGRKLYRIFKQSINLHNYNPTKIFRKLQMMFHRQSSEPPEPQPHHDTEERDISVQEIGFGFGRLNHSDSSSSSINTLCQETCSLSPKPTSTSHRVGNYGRRRNLVI